MGLAVVLASSDVLPTFAEELNTTEVVTEEVTTENSEVTTPSNEIVVEGNTAIVPVTEFAEYAASKQNDENEAGEGTEEENVTEVLEDSSSTGDDAVDKIITNEDVTNNDVTGNDVTDNDVTGNDVTGNDVDEAEPITVFDVEQDGVRVVVTASEEGALPEGAELKVTEMEVTSSMEEAVYDALENVSTIKAYDITFYDAKGNEIEPSDKVFVSIFLTEATEDFTEDLTVFHYDEEENAVEDMEAVAVDGEITFETDHFSPYLLVSTSTSKSGLVKSVYLTMEATGNENVEVKAANKDSKCVRVLIFVDGERVETYPSSNYFVYKGNLSFKISDIDSKYSLKEVKTANKALNNAPSNDYEPSNNSKITADKSGNYTASFNNYGSNNKKYYGFVCIYLETKTAKLSLNKDGLNVSSTKEYKIASTIANTEKSYLQVNLHDANGCVTYPADDKYYEISADKYIRNVGDYTQDTFSFSYQGENEISRLLYNEEKVENFKNVVLYAAGSNDYEPNTLDIFVTPKGSNNLDNDYAKITSSNKYYIAANDENPNMCYFKVRVHANSDDVTATYPANGYYAAPYEDWGEYTRHVNRKTYNGYYTFLNDRLSIDGKNGWTVDKFTYSNDVFEDDSDNPNEIDYVGYYGDDSITPSIAENYIDIYLTKPLQTNDNSDIKVTLVDYNACTDKETVDKETFQQNGKSVYNINYKKTLLFGNATFRSNNSDVSKLDGINGYSTDNDKKVHAGIVQNMLENGYPVLQDGSSLAYLFNANTHGVATYTENAYGILSKDNGRYYFNGKTDGVTINQDGTVSIKKRNSGNFLPFPKNGTSDNFYFGMKVEAEFIQPTDGMIGNQPMVYSFSGDDDVWVFIDDVLVLDIGGIHGELPGSIDFNTGKVDSPQIAYDFKSDKGSIDSIYEAFDMAGVASEVEWETTADGNVRFADASVHKLTMFYFERGGAISNCTIDFNIQTIPTDKVIVGKHIASLTESDKEKTFKFAVKRNGELVSEGYPYSIQRIGSTESSNGTVGPDGIISLGHDEMAYFDFSVGDKIEVTELNSDADEVWVNSDNKGCPNGEAVSASLTVSGDGGNALIFKNAYISDPRITTKKTASLEDFDNRIYNLSLEAEFHYAKYTGDTFNEWEWQKASATIKDVIDPRFYAVDDNGNTLKNGASVADGGVLHISDNESWVEWTISKLGKSDLEWKSSIRVKAREDFLGGNNVTTNGYESAVTINEYNLRTRFPQPTVNVKNLELALENGKTTLFLLEEVKPEDYVNKLVESVKAVKLDDDKFDFDDLSTTQISELIKNKKLEKAYEYEGKAFGTICYELSSDGKFENHKATELGAPYETYNLSVKYIPYTKSVNSTIGSVQGEKNTSGKYEVYVEDGSIKLVKKIKKSDIEWTDGNPTFLFKLTSNDLSVTKYVTFDKANLTADENGYISLDITFTGLGKAAYTVEELPSLGYSIESARVTEGVGFANYSASTKNFTVTLGGKDANGDFNCKASLEVVNQKKPEYFMDCYVADNTVSKEKNGVTITSTVVKDSTDPFANN